MIHHTQSRIVAILSLLIAGLSIWATLEGIADEELYNQVYWSGSLSKRLIYGSRAQDFVSLPVALILLVCSILHLSKKDYISLIILTGLAGYFFYAYGLYTLQGQYTSLYLVYMAIFGLSIYALIFGLTSFTRKLAEKLHLQKWLRISVATFFLMIVLFLAPIWIIQMIPDISNHRPSDTYAVYLLDLSIIFPAFAIIALFLLRKKTYGTILAGVMLFKVLTLTLSVAIGEWYLPLHMNGMPNYPMILFFSLLTLISLILLFFYIRQIRQTI